MIPMPVRRRALPLLLATLLLPALAAAKEGRAAVAAPAAPRGTLVIVGGGDWPPGVARTFVDLAAKHGTGAVVVVTTASGVPEESGPELVKDFTDAGARSVARRHWTRADALAPEAAAVLDGAGGVFFSGGDQGRVTEALLGTPLLDRLKALFADGAVIGGTSAGAAIMSEVMITGDERRKAEAGREWSTIEAGNVVTAPGLGFVTWGVVDQHFLARRRGARLISVVAEHPKLLGVGIDEGMAIVVPPDGTFRVVGPTQVAVYDASRAEVRAGAAGPIGLRGLVLHLLTDGDAFDVAARAVAAAKGPRP